MKIELGERTAETVALYFSKAQQQIIKSTLPQKAATLEEALNDYEDTLKPNATSYGRTIIIDGMYVGASMILTPDERTDIHRAPF